MKKNIAIWFIIAMLCSYVNAAEITDSNAKPIDITFNKAGGGKHILCNNPEAITADDLSSIENNNPKYIMTNKDMGIDKYSVFISHYNLDNFDMEFDMEFKTEDRAVIKISALAFEVARNDEYRFGIGTWADYKQFPVKRMMHGEKEYIPQKFETIIFEVKNEPRWLSEFIYNYQTVRTQQNISVLADFEIISGTADVNITALRHNGTLKDRSHHNPDAAPGKYVWDKCLKGIADTLPTVYSNLDLEIEPNTPVNENIPIKIYNSYYPNGNEFDKWVTHLSPLADKWAKHSLVESDIISYTYKDSSKLDGYGKNVPIDERDDLWVFDINRSDTRFYQPGMDVHPDDFVPNYTFEADLNKPINEHWICGFGNYAISTKYNVSVKNNAESLRYFDFYVSTASSIIIGIYDNNGNLLNPRTLTTAGAYLANKESQDGRIPTIVANIPVMPGDLRSFTVELILPTNTLGGIETFMQFSDKPVEIKETTPIQTFAEKPLNYEDFLVGDTVHRWENGSLYKMNEKDKTWEEVVLPKDTKDFLLDKYSNFEITEIPNGFVMRFSSFDGGTWQQLPEINNRFGKLYLLDKDYNITETYDFNRYVSGFSYLDGKYYAETTDKSLYSSDFKNWFDLNGKIPMVSNNTSLLNDGSNLKKITNDFVFAPVAFETPREWEVYQTGEIYYCLKSWKRQNSDLVTPNIISFSKDGISWYDMELPNRLLIFDGIKLLYSNNELRYFIDCRFDNFEVPLEKVNALFKDSVYINLEGSYLGFDVQPVLFEDRTLVPVRFFFEKLGAKVDWNDGEVTVSKGNDLIIFNIEDKSCEVNGEVVNMDVPAKLIEDKTMIPLRFISEGLGYRVEWNELTDTGGETPAGNRVGQFVEITQYSARDVRPPKG